MASKPFVRIAIAAVPFVFSLLPLSSHAALPAKGSLIKASAPAVYWYGQDGKRYVFPNDKTYFTWFADFGGVRTVTDNELASIMIGGNVAYRPGKLLVKIQSDPKTYAVDGGATLRWVKTEAAATTLYGSDWNKKVHDIPDAFFVNYKLGTDISVGGDYSVSAALSGSATLDAELAKRVSGYPTAPVATGPTVVAENLDTPWDIAFMPDGDMLVTERPGRLRRLGASPASIAIPGVKESGEGGLMGLTLHPDFASNKLIYVYFTAGTTGSENKIIRYKLENNALVQDKVIISGIPSAIYHDGGRIAFGPDGMLYATTGDATDANLAQDKNSLAGKVLRLTADGAIPSDNPFGTAVWSWGHRNSQGLAWDAQGRLWATEHGRSGSSSGYDELNLIVKGGNYGWPTIQGSATQQGMIAPVLHSGATTTWAPSGIARAGTKLFWAGLAGESLYEATIESNGTVSGFKAHWKGTYGRLRAVTLGPDGHLYISTSNRDGRGSPAANDDRIIKVHPDAL